MDRHVSSLASPKMLIDTGDMSMNDFRTNSKEDYDKSPYSLHTSATFWKRIEWKTLLLVFFGLMIGFLMGLDQSSSLQQQQRMDTLIARAGTTTTTTRAGVETTPLELLGAVRKTRQFLLQQLKADYGEYASSFLDKNNLASIFQISEGSRNKFHRKILEKIVTKQLRPTEKVSITWVSTGDAAAAGYGSLPSDSYTSVMEDTVSQAFNSLGLNFVAVNYGIEGLGSGLEAALCMETLFGDDIDFLSWDFATSDRDQDYRAALWGVRAAAHQSHPLVVMLGDKESPQWTQLSRMEDRVGISLMDLAALPFFRQQYLPDSNRFTHPEQLPPALQYYQCNGAVEGTFQCSNKTTHFVCMAEMANSCQAHKFYSEMTCEYQQHHSPWIHGWKEHRLRGRLLGLFLVQLLQDALLDLQATTQNLNAPLHQQWHLIMDLFRQQDFQDQFVAQNSAIPPDVLGPYAESMSDLALPLFERPATCLLPDTVIHRLEQGNRGHQKTNENITEITPHTIKNCKPFEFGHREAFQVVKDSDGQGFRLDIRPPDITSSFLIACFRTCTTADCHKVMDGLDSVKVANGNILIEVDGIKVAGSREMDSCHFLEGEHGLHWATKNQEYFDIRFHVKEEGGLLLLFSVVAMQTSAEHTHAKRRKHQGQPSK